MVLYILTGYHVLGIAYLNQLTGAHHIHISYHNILATTQIMISKCRSLKQVVDIQKICGKSLKLYNHSKCFLNNDKLFL